MNKTKVWVSIFAAASSIGLVAYAVSRRAAPSRELQSKVRPPKSSAALPVRIAAIATGEPGQSVELLVKAPRLASADDSETLDADDLGRDWLARAAQSEPSPSELDLDVALDDIADPNAETDITASLEAAESDLPT